MLVSSKPKIIVMTDSQTLFNIKIPNNYVLTDAVTNSRIQYLSNKTIQLNHSYHNSGTDAHPDRL